MHLLINKLKNEDISNKIYIIGIDGLGGSGKTTIVKPLQLQLQNENYHSYVLHIDDFIHPRSIRYNYSKDEWDCYYNLQWRYDYLVKEILSPIKNGELIDKDIELYNKENDNYFTERVNLNYGSVLILEGIFLQRKELRDYLDFTVFLDVPQKIRLNRVLSRDKYIGGFHDIKYKYENRYFPAEEKYILEYSPATSADLVLK